MFGQSLLSAFGIACTTDTDQLFNPTSTQINSTATYQLNSDGSSIPSNTYPLATNGITFASGKFGNAAGFSSGNASTGDYMKVSNSIYGSSTTVFSWSLWIKCDNTTGTGINIMGNGALAGGQTGYTVYLYNGRLALSTLQSSDQYFPNPESNGTLINDNQWHNIVLTYNNGSFVLYLDGSPNQTGTSSNYINNATPANDTYIGNSFQRGISDGIVNGQIDQVRVFGGTILNQDAITALYNETTTTAQNAYITEEVYNGIAYYKMSDATDQLGNYNGTATNVNFNTEGKFGFAGAFNGSSSKIDIASTITGNNSFSVSFWLNPTANNVTPFMMGNAATGQAFLTFVTGNTLNFGRGGDSLGSTTSNTIPNNTWTHIAVSSNAGSVVVYVNGVSNLTFSTTYNIGSGGTFIGYASGYGQYFNGKIDQIRMYDSALSAADVTTLYKEVECEPAAINALANFNTVLYSGNSNTQSITGVGFEPNFTWIKRRDGSENHYLQDSVRGSTKQIYSNLSNAEYDETSAVTSFDSDGFTMGSYNGVNNSGETYVAWNWKAPLANLSTEFNSNRQGQITLPNSITTPWNTSSEFGVSCWINPSTWGSSQQTQAFYFNGPNSGNIGFDKEPSGNFRCFVTTSGGSFIGVNSSNNLSATNKWYHIVWTGSAAAGVKLYVDGVNTGSASWDGTYLNSGGSNYIGVSPQSLRGNIAQFRVYSSYLTSSEVSDLYAEPAASNNTLNYPAGAGCIAAYPLQTDAVDLSGNYSGASSNVTFGQPGYLTGNTDGTIPSTVAVNAEAGFSIVKYIGSTGNTSFGTGLTSEAEFIIFKRYTSAQNWFVFVKINNVWHYIEGLNTASAAVNYSSSMSATSTTVTLPSLAEFNQDTSSSYIAYCLTSIPGYSHISSYSGGSSGSSNVIYIGFKPKFLIVKRTDQAGDAWQIFDSTMAGAETFDDYLQANTSAAEASYSQREVNFVSNGFYWTYAESGTNISGGNYIYLAIA